MKYYMYVCSKMLSYLGCAKAKGLILLIWVKINRSKLLTFDILENLSTTQQSILESSDVHPNIGENVTKDPSAKPGTKSSFIIGEIEINPFHLTNLL